MWSPQEENFAHSVDGLLLFHHIFSCRVSERCIWHSDHMYHCMVSLLCPPLSLSWLLNCIFPSSLNSPVHIFYSFLRPFILPFLLPAPFFCLILPVVYLHENHAVTEWSSRMPSSTRGQVVAACHDETVARTAKAAGFKNIFYAKNSNTAGLTNTVLEAVEFAKSLKQLL